MVTHVHLGSGGRQEKKDGKKRGEVSEEMTRAQGPRAPKSATTAQVGPPDRSKTPIPTNRKRMEEPPVTDAYFRAPANRNSNGSASQRQGLLPASFVLPWRPDGRIQMRRGAQFARPDADAQSPASLHHFLPRSRVGGLVRRLGARPFGLREVL